MSNFYKCDNDQSQYVLSIYEKPYPICDPRYVKENVNTTKIKEENDTPEIKK